MIFVLIFVTAKNETFRIQITCYLYLLIFVFYSYQAAWCMFRDRLLFDVILSLPMGLQKSVMVLFLTLMDPPKLKTPIQNSKFSEFLLHCSSSIWRKVVFRLVKTEQFMNSCWNSGRQYCFLGLQIFKSNYTDGLKKCWKSHSIAQSTTCILTYNVWVFAIISTI